MAFPTIPLVADGRVLTGVQANTTATRTFPNLSSLTKNAGDLLIAICVAYQSSVTNAAFSGWGAGFTEFHDSSSSTTMAIGVAYKWSNGSEAGTFAVTQAATITGHATMILLSIPGAHDTTPPEAGSRASGTTTAADCAAFDPAGWAAEDTLWISVAGCGETGTGGAFQGMAGAGGGNPTNYGDNIATGISADAVGGVEGGAYFRQLNAASENVGPISPDVSNARNAAIIIAVRPAAGPTTFQQALPAASTFSVVIAKQLSLGKTLSATSTFSASLTRQLSLNRALAVASTFTAAVQRRIDMTIAVASTFTPSLVSGLVFQKALDVASSFGAGLSESATFIRSLSVDSVFAPVLDKANAFSQTLAAGLSALAGLVADFIPGEEGGEGYLLRVKAWFLAVKKQKIVSMVKKKKKK